MARKPNIMDGFESPRLPGKPFMLIAAGALIFLGLSMGVLFALFDVSVTDRAPRLAQPAPEPRLQPHPRHELAITREDERARLKESGGGTMPIEKAMAIIAARGANAYAPIQTRGGKP
ncbi:MAG TPA: hypothetical protein VFC54_13350 [Pseudolabrys sp.]|nr:hypothetical protein [Pseudolabrys sp.]